MNNPAEQTALASARQLAAQFQLQSRSVFETKTHWILFLWTGTRATKTIQFALRKEGLEANFPNLLFPWVLSVTKTGDLSKLHKFLEDLSSQPNPVPEIVDAISAVAAPGT
jgi:hypothetical protein